MCMFILAIPNAYNPTVIRVSIRSFCLDALQAGSPLKAHKFGVISFWIQFSVKSPKLIQQMTFVSAQQAILRSESKVHMYELFWIFKSPLPQESAFPAATLIVDERAIANIASSEYHDPKSGLFKSRIGLEWQHFPAQAPALSHWSPMISCLDFSDYQWMGPQIRVTTKVDQKGPLNKRKWQEGTDTTEPVKTYQNTDLAASYQHQATTGMFQSSTSSTSSATGHSGKSSFSFSALPGPTVPGNDHLKNIPACQSLNTWPAAAPTFESTSDVTLPSSNNHSNTRQAQNDSNEPEVSILPLTFEPLSFS